MKKIILPLFVLAITAGILRAQNDTMYVMRSGTVIGKYSTLEVDSVIFYKPLESGAEISDYDGNVYPTVVIGTQTWMAENLKTTHYSDGTPIPEVTGNDNWNALSSKSQAFCWYDDDRATYANTYGAMYTWAAAMKGAESSDAMPSEIQGICPSGWHLPSEPEWTVLVSYLIANGFNYDGTSAGNKVAKSLAASKHWYPSSVEGSIGNPDYPNSRNQTGFSLLPAGYRDSFGIFNYIGNEGYWWAATEFSASAGWFRTLAYYNSDFLLVVPLCYYKEMAASVRCIKD